MRVLGDIPVRNAKLFPRKEGLIDEHQRFTFRDLNDQINGLSNALQAKFGLRPGDRVALLSKNCHQYVVVYFAAQKVGLILVPLNYMLTFEELSFMVNDCQANTLFLSSEFMGFLEIARKRCGCLKNYILIDEEKFQQDLVDYEDLISSSSKKEPEIKVDETSDSIIIYTSGSTGRPKGVILTHENLICNSTNMVMEEGIQCEDVCLNFLPMFASMPEQFLPFFFVGAKNVILSEFNPKTIFETIEREKITFIDAVPTMYISLLESPEIERYDLSSLRMAIYGSAPMPKEVLKRFMGRFPKVLLYQGYGLTEAGVTVCMLRPEDQLKKMGSIGKEIINVDVRIVDDEGKDVTIGPSGELICQSKAVMRGYHNLPDETEKALRNGWLYTGDLARQDEEGYIYLVGRKKDIIKSGGFGVAPAEVEDVLYKHPLIMEAAVFGIPHPKWGEAIHAVVTLKEGACLTPEEIIEFCKGKIAGYKRPKSVEIVADLPKTSIGKIDKRLLREKYW